LRVVSNYGSLCFSLCFCLRVVFKFAFQKTDLIFLSMVFAIVPAVLYGKLCGNLRVHVWANFGVIIQAVSVNLSQQSHHFFACFDLLCYGLHRSFPLCVVFGPVSVVCLTGES